jgi:S1-C subfamily serine protease
MRKRLLATAIFAVAIIITVQFNGFIVPSTAVAQQQQINSNSSSSPNSNSSSPNPLSLNTIFKQVENSVVQIKSKIPPNTTALGSGFVYDKQGHIVTNGHVVGDAKVVDVTFVDGNRYSAKVIVSDI